MSKVHSYYRSFLLLFILTSSLGCMRTQDKKVIQEPYDQHSIPTPDIHSEEITKQEISQPNIYSISKFILNQLDEEGNPHFSLTSSKALVNPITGNMDASDIVINIDGKDLLFNIM